MTDKALHLSRYQGKIVTIDGPAGSGKSTTAKQVAARLGYAFLDTGAMYRAVTNFAIKNDIAPSDGKKLAAAAKGIPIDFVNADGENRILFNGEDVSEEIRSPEVTRLVSEVSAHEGVRRAMVAKQREIGKNGSIVAEGRDTGSIVFPKADLKIYLDASVEQRAQRRLLDMARLGVSTDLEEQKAEIIRRDRYDSTRANSPLVRPTGSVMVDTSEMTIEGQVDHIITLFREIVR